MEFERKLPSEKKRVTPKRLLDVCQRFADILANGQWPDSENRKVSIKRSFTEVIGHSSDATIGGEPVREIKMTTKVVFKGEKELDDDSEDLNFEEFYTIKAKMSEVLHHSMLPATVLSKFVEDVYMDDEDEAEDDDSMVPVPPEGVTDEVLDAFLFERENEIIYMIDQEGEPFSYRVVVRYKADGATIEQSRYGWNDNDKRNQYVPTSLINDNPLEWRLAHQAEFEEEDIVNFLNSFDQVIEDVINVEEFEAMQDGMYPDRDAHHRRALAIIAMVAIGFKQMKF